MKICEVLMSASLKFDQELIASSLKKGLSLAVADQILMDPRPGRLNPRLQELLAAILESGAAQETVVQTLLRLGMNFAGRDSEIVGYSPAEAAGAYDAVIHVLSGLPADFQNATSAAVKGFLFDMKSVNLANSLPGLLAERIEEKLDLANPGVSFLQLLKPLIHEGIYFRMIGEGYGKFGNDFARGLEYLRHFGFCQVSTNPVLAAKAFDEDPKLTDELKYEIAKHAEWRREPEANGDAMALAATLIALWPNLSIFRPLALHTGLKDYMVSFQLNPNLADQAEASIVDARQAYHLAADYLREYDRHLGLGEKSGTIGPNIVFKIAGCHEAAREITKTLNGEGIGSNNTVVYTVAQEIQLILDAFEGKAKAIKAGKTVTRTYETNMGGRFSSHLREVVAEELCVDAAAKIGEAKAAAFLANLAKAIKVDEATLNSLEDRPFAEKVGAVTSFKFMKTLDLPDMLAIGEAAGSSASAVLEMEEDIKKAGTLVARRVYAAFYSAPNRPRWVSWLEKTHGLTAAQAIEILDSMDVLPASKRIPEDTYHALGARNMCHTEFPNHSRAVQIMAEKSGFRLEEFKESILASYAPGVSSRLSQLLDDYNLGYELTPALQKLLVEEVGIAEASSWGAGGIEPVQWPQFGAVQKTTAEFREAYFNFRAKCVAIAKDVAGH
jgi:transaldolase